MNRVDAECSLVSYSIRRYLLSLETLKNSTADCWEPILDGWLAIPHDSLQLDMRQHTKELIGLIDVFHEVRSSPLIAKGYLECTQNRQHTDGTTDL